MSILLDIHVTYCITVLVYMKNNDFVLKITATFVWHNGRRATQLGKFVWHNAHRNWGTTARRSSGKRVDNTNCNTAQSCGVVHTFLRLRSMQPGRTLNNIVYTTTNEYSMYVTYRSERRKQHPGTTANCPKTSKQRRVRTSFRSRRDTRKRGHEYQFPGRVPLKKPSGVNFLQTSHEISKFPGCTCTQRSMTGQIRWRSRSSNAIRIKH